MATRKKTTKRATKNGWKTCSRGHHYRGSYCARCWPGREETAKPAKR